MKLAVIKKFQRTVWNYYHQHKRDFAWRQTTDPYCIMVSEVMLQQTQTHRVVGKYEHFVQTFSTVHALAAAPLRNVLLCWQGLGYNRRALALHRSAQIIIREFDGIIPQQPEILITLPGIGANTAASICAFAFNQPTVFIETNIRSVFIYFFFQGRADVKDQEIYPLVEQSLDKNDPRQWYYALMDYGVMLKKQLPNPSRRSAHYTKQSVFEGSDRQVRGLVLKFLTQSGGLSTRDIAQRIDREHSRVQRVVQELTQEGFVHCKEGVVEVC